MLNSLFPGLWGHSTAQDVALGILSNRGKVFRLDVPGMFSI